MKLKKILPIFLILLFIWPLAISGCKLRKSESERLKEEITDISTENSRLKKDLNDLKAENSNMHSRLAQLNVQISGLQNEIQALKRDLDNFKAQLKKPERKNRKS